MAGRGWQMELGMPLDLTGRSEPRWIAREMFISQTPAIILFARSIRRGRAALWRGLREWQGARMGPTVGRYLIAQVELRWTVPGQCMSRTRGTTPFEKSPRLGW